MQGHGERTYECTDGARAWMRAVHARVNPLRRALACSMRVAPDPAGLLLASPTPAAEQQTPDEQQDHRADERYDQAVQVEAGNARMAK